MKVFVNGLPYKHEELAKAELSLRTLMRECEYALNLNAVNGVKVAELVPPCGKVFSATGITYLEAVTNLVVKVKDAYPHVYLGSTTEKLVKQLDAQPAH